jgi:predicted small integral membrane protein
MAIRGSKTVLVASAALFYALVVFNNIVDYGSNEAFVRGVLSMEDTFGGQEWRAVTSPFVQDLFYWSIIALEALAFLFITIGALRMFAARRADRATFHQAKGAAVTGMTIGLVLWMVAFLTVGGEWFLMWQSSMWNGQDAAFRMFASFGIVLVYLAMPDPRLAGEPPGAGTAA